MTINNVMRGTVYVLGDNIDTDQILTAEYLKINPVILLGLMASQPANSAALRKLEKSRIPVTSTYQAAGAVNRALHSLCRTRRSVQ